MSLTTGLVKETGGARIGIANATWPFATLTVTKDKLQLNATIIGNLFFKPSDIISIEVYSSFLSKGLKINHRVSEYKDNVIFWTFSSPTDIIKKIELTGFLTNSVPIAKEMEDYISKAQTQGGFPLKTKPTISIIIIWNIFLLMDFQNFFEENRGSSLNHGAQLGLGFMLLTCILLLTVEPVRRLILKEGRTIADIKIFVFFTMLICGFIFLIITLTP